MKYLVNRETKEHRIYTDGDWKSDSLPSNDNLDDWIFVDADEEGWIRWVPKSEARPSAQDIMDNYNCRFNEFGRIEYYRPILPSESKPEFKTSSEWQPIPIDDDLPKKVNVYTGGGPDVFTRLASAVDASDSIPALIAEINAMLPEGYEVREKAKPQAAGLSIASQMGGNASQHPNYMSYMNCANQLRI